MAVRRPRRSLTSRADELVAVVLIQAVGPSHELHLTGATNWTSLHGAARHVTLITSGQSREPSGIKRVQAGNAIAGIRAVTASNALVIDHVFLAPV
jgi:hypothetical protein